MNNENLILLSFSLFLQVHMFMISQKRHIQKTIKRLFIIIMLDEKHVCHLAQFFIVQKTFSLYTALTLYFFRYILSQKFFDIVIFYIFLHR